MKYKVLFYKLLLNVDLFCYQSFFLIITHHIIVSLASGTMPWYTSSLIIFALLSPFFNYFMLYHLFLSWATLIQWRPAVFLASSAHLACGHPFPLFSTFVPSSVFYFCNTPNPLICFWIPQRYMKHSPFHSFLCNA